MAKNSNKKGSWNQMMKNDPDFHSKFELNERLSGPTYVPSGSQNSKGGEDIYHPNNPSFNDFSGLAYEGSADDL